MSTPRLPGITDLTNVETELDILQAILGFLQTLKSTLAPLTTQDSVQRQRVVVESLTGINGITGYQNITQINTITNGATPPTQGTGIVNMVWEAPVDQRYRVADAARTMAYLQRQNITFS